MRYRYGGSGPPLRHLGHDSFAVAGHDRGARVVHRLCLDSPERVLRAAVLDIVPTLHMYTHSSRELMLTYWALALHGE